METNRKKAGRPVDATAAEFRDMDQWFAEFIREFDSTPEIVNLAGLLSWHLSRGDICLDIRAIDWNRHGINGMPDTSGLSTILEKSPVVSLSGDDSYVPMVFDPPLLYLRKFHDFQQILAQGIVSRVRRAGKPFKTQEFASLIGGMKQGYSPLQAAAVAAGLQTGFLVISGGPGTGKTFTVAALLSVMLRHRPQTRIAVCAPTGKAAMKLNESIGARLQNGSAETASLSKNLHAQTLHRLLGARRSGGGYRHTRENPLTYEIIIVDESSMVDIAMMARLFSAAGQASIILLGDRHQLASVEAGSVFADICDAFGVNRFSASFADGCRERIAPDENLFHAHDNGTNAVIELQRNFRFSEGSGIGRVSTLIRKQHDPESIVSAMKQEDSCVLIDTDEDMENILRKYAMGPVEKCAAAESPEAGLDSMNAFRILTAVRKGATGVEEINRLVEQMLARKNPEIHETPWYTGRQIMVTANDYYRKLYNGDGGIVLHAEDSARRIYFRDDSGRARGLLPAFIPEHETAYAITVHKSQGSEYDEVLILLPNEDSPVLTRELIYTAITRARRKATIIGKPEILLGALERCVQRNSGLKKNIDQLLAPPCE